MKKEEGITLIALVITIIVLLILAGAAVSIGLNEKDLFSKANEAKTEWNEKAERENKTINDYMEYSNYNPTGDALEGLSDAEIALLPTEVSEKTIESISNENLKDAKKIKAVITDSDNGETPIPKGANYIGGTESTGVIIEYKGSQFVWIPVPATADNSLYVKGTTKPMAKTTIVNGLGIDANGKTNYQGILYDYSGTGDSPTSIEKTDYGQGTASYREPDIVTGNSDDIGTNYDGDFAYYNTVLEYDNAANFKTALQEEYNKMIESVSKYGGFFVGRYETSYNTITRKVESVSDVDPTSASDNFTSSWYGLYQKQKEFTLTTDIMASSMIWGSQYDAMLNWAIEGADKSHITTGGNGNRRKNAWQEETAVNTGTMPNDVINNIYDLEGNLNEWTLEAYSSNMRVQRGGSFMGSSRFTWH